MADLLQGDYKQSDYGKVILIRTLIRGRLMQSGTLHQQAAAISKEQFANSPDFGTELLDAISVASIPTRR